MTDREIQLLLRPETYDEPVEAVRLIQTHTSWVLLTGAHAYKIKKPVYFGFLDYTTLDARKFFCEEELRLNQRLSPDIYLGVVPITKEDGKLKVGGTGAVVDYCLRMRELPQNTIMTEVLRRKAVTYSMIDEIARIVAGFHERAATDLEIGKFGSLETIKFNWDENFAQTEEFKRRTIGSAAFRSIKEEVERFMVENRSLFSRRIRERRVRECHGDLHSRNIFIGEHVRIFDCIEFNRRFSCCDVASEIAFFVMDLEYYGEKGLANYFVDRYLALTRDHSLLKVLDFYKCYRAYVRGKVTSFNLNDPGIPARARTEAAQTAREYFRLAARYARHFFDRPGLILTIGLPGVGKTYLASRLARKLDCYHLRSDILRKELTEVPVGEHRFEGMNKGIYTSNISARTYDEMLRRARYYLSAGRTVILDATFSMADGRRRAEALARACNARFLMVDCVCPVKTALSRINRRKHEFSFSDATPEVYQRIRRNFDPVRKSRHAIRADTSQPVTGLLRKIEAALLRL